ncbi:phospholipid/cholesterol/gamma-HCH transport system substrate-binding protein [Saccharothrix ecbatanensis]|jgi:phospholipid/cholesterol/gamma-HCH transport system substrate-binding protein|uniref:Phospholipid/cholesterol/gamma-HCH transport system substrate-binding protein n=1 Tax=Saccharothrix ecbatanensis TaxID=1105145 RepID=A0A7W9HPS4_9PSEU|nr:MCE family protein [Saccharothrix ecbatanensis]MBB5806237.1 phospholipid/cholesterol/gamma-HCH transport system substrate-binding protein [Saccharothrix ecbatanensis]
MRSLVAPLVKLGVFAAITILATTLLAVTISNVNFNGATTYTARFTDVTALNKGDDIRIAGVRIGQVDEIRVVDRRVAEVEFSLEGERTLPASVTATIKYRNLVGQRYVALEHGVGDASPLKPGDLIPLERTKPALDLTALFNGFKPLFQALNPDDVNQLSNEIIQVLQGESGTIDSLLRHTASLTSTLAGRDKVIGEVIDNLNAVLDTVNSRTDQVSTLVTTLEELTAGLAGDRQPIGDAISALGDLTNTTAGLLEEARQPLKDNIANLGLVSQTLADNEAVVEGVIQNLPGKLEGLTRTASYGSWFNFFLCEGSGTVSVPPVLNDPITITPLPITQPRCRP